MGILGQLFTPFQRENIHLHITAANGRAFVSATNMQTRKTIANWTADEINNMLKTGELRGSIVGDKVDDVFMESIWEKLGASKWSALAPMPPSEGPPLPRFLNIRWPKFRG